MNMKIDKIYIIHFPCLTERKQYMDEKIKEFNIPYEYVCKYVKNSVEISDKNFIDTSDTNKNRKNSMLVGDKLSEGVCENNLKACTLEHYNIIKTFYEETDHDNILILQDDIIFDDRYEGFEQYLKVLPEDYDLLYLSSVCGIKLKAESGNILDLQPSRESNGGGAYMVSRKAAKIITENALPLYSNWDWELNCLQIAHKLNVYWVISPMLYDGSEIGKYKRSY